MYTVEKIIGKRENPNKKGKFEYLVKWEGWGVKDSTWEPKKHLEYVKDLIQQYEKTLEPSMIIRDTSQQGSSAQMTDENESKHEEMAPKRGRGRPPTSTSTASKEKKSISSSMNESKATYQNSIQNEESVKIFEPQSTRISLGLQILGMKKEGNQFWYYIIDPNGKECWVSREYIVKNFPVNLCEFYQQRIVFNG